jgi:hypothetical protein
MEQHADITNGRHVVTGTLAWPTINNTRLTLFDLMDHLKQAVPPHLVAQWYNLSRAEMDTVMQFLKEHEAAIEQSYAAANVRAATQRHYWETKNRDVLARDVSQLPPPPHADARWFALRDKFIAAKQKLIEQLDRVYADPHRP